MTAFEKWYKENQIYADRSHAKESWKAALSWLYDKLDYSQEHEDIKDIIEEELK